MVFLPDIIPSRPKTFKVPLSEQLHRFQAEDFDEPRIVPTNLEIKNEVFVVHVDLHIVEMNDGNFQSVLCFGVTNESGR